MLERGRPAARGRHGESTVRDSTAAGARNGFAGDGAAAFEFIGQASRGRAGDVSGKGLELRVEFLAGGEAGQLSEGVGEFDLFGGADRFPRLGPRSHMAQGPGKRPGRADVVAGFPRGDHGAGGLRGHFPGELEGLFLQGAVSQAGADFLRDIRDEQIDEGVGDSARPVRMHGVGGLRDERHDEVALGSNEGQVCHRFYC